MSNANASETGSLTADIEEATYLLGELRKLAAKYSDRGASRSSRTAATKMLRAVVLAGQEFEDVVHAEGRAEDGDTTHAAAMNRTHNEAA